MCAGVRQHRAQQRSDQLLHELTTILDGTTAGNLPPQSVNAAATAAPGSAGWVAGTALLGRSLDDPGVRAELWLALTRTAP